MIHRSLRTAMLFGFLLVSGAVAGHWDAAPRPARYLYVWASIGSDSAAGPDLMVVLDANPSSPHYGSILAALTVDSAGRNAHHTEYVLPPRGPLVVSDYAADKAFLIDFSTPLSPRLSGRVAKVPHGRMLHSFARLPNGNVVATIQFGDSAIAGSPGGLAEFDRNGALLRSGWSRDSAFPAAHIRTYGLTVLPGADRAVTTSSPMSRETTADVIQVWRLSDLTLLKTLTVAADSDSVTQHRPFEVRALDDGTVMLNAYNCAFFHISGLTATPRITRVLTLPANDDAGCAVPVIIGHFMVMPIAYAHRYATIDIADPDHPVEVASLKTRSTFFPHWAAADPGSDRIVVTDQGDGVPVVKIVRLDRATGRLSWDPRFKDPVAASPGVSFDRAAWPNGARGMATPHGALFVP
ncbi:MAG: hypothetical protein ACREN6_00765 [Gemmatimonadaceae bacterium]